MPFIPRISFAAPAERAALIKRDEVRTPSVFTPHTTDASKGEKKVFGNNKPKAGTGKSPFSFGDRYGGKKALKTRGYAEDDGGFRRAGKSSLASEKKERDIDDIKQTLTDKTGQEITIPEVLTVKEFSEKI